MGKQKLNYGMCSEGFKCFYTLDNGRMCGHIEKNMNTMQKHCQTHVDPGIVARRKEKDRIRDQDPKRKVAKYMSSKKSKAKVRADPVRFEERKKKERERAAEYRANPEFAAIQAERDKRTRANQINTNTENDVWLSCHVNLCDFKTRCKKTLNAHISTVHNYEQKTAPYYKAMVGKRFKSLCANATTTILHTDSQEFHSPADFLAADLATEAWNILKELLVHRKYYTYWFLCTDPHAKEMGLVPYLESIKNSADEILNWYVGKSVKHGPSEYHSDATIVSTVRQYCEKNNKIAYLIYVKEHDIGDRYENKVAAEENELYWQLIGEFQAGKINDGRCQYEMINTKTELAIGKENKILDENFVRETAHVAMACDSLFCMDFVTGDCDKVHNANGLCRDYGKKHLDFSDLQPFDFVKRPSGRQPKTKQPKKEKFANLRSTPLQEEESSSDSDDSTDFDIDNSDSDFQ